MRTSGNYFGFFLIVTFNTLFSVKSYSSLQLSFCRLLQLVSIYVNVDPHLSFSLASVFHYFTHAWCTELSFRLPISFYLTNTIWWRRKRVPKENCTYFRPYNLLSWNFMPRRFNLDRLPIHQCQLKIFRLSVSSWLPLYLVACKSPLALTWLPVCSLIHVRQFWFVPLSIFGY